MIIITNILAAITVVVVTNSTDEFTQEYFGGWYPEGPMPTAEKVKHTRTVVKEQRLLCFEFEGTHWTNVVSEKVLSDVSVKYRTVPQEPQWAPVATNEVRWNVGVTDYIRPSGTFTNEGKYLISIFTNEVIYSK